MSKYWSGLVHSLTPYVPGEQPKLDRLIKLNTNENPYGPSPRALEAMRRELGESLRRYPDPTSGPLLDAAARAWSVPREFLFAGNGSDEVLAHVFQGLLKHEQPLLFPDVTYSFYPVYCRLFGIAYQEVPVRESFELHVDDYLQPNGGIIFPNPNAPTGMPLALSEIERLLEANRESVVVIDEAYVDFGAESAVTLTKRYPQLLVTHTLSKSRSLAGLRVGLAVGQPELIQALVRVKDSFNSYPLDRVAIAGAAAALEDSSYFNQTRALVMQARNQLTLELTALGMQVLPSTANFVFARHPAWEGKKLAEALRERAVLVRHFAAPRIDRFLRITVGLPEENAALVSALAEILAR